MTSRPATAAVLPDYDIALSQALQAVARCHDTDEVALEESAGRVLRQPVLADRDLPPFNRAQMDGYAVRAADLQPGCALPVAATIAAGASPETDVPPGACVKIATGAAVPAGLDAVVQHEQSDRADPVRFTIDHVRPGNAIHPRGADAGQGDVLLEPGVFIAAHHIGLAAAVGCTTLTCARRPTAVVISSGDELRPVNETPLPHQIRNSNGPMITAFLKAMGAHPVAAHHVVDDLRDTSRRIAEAIEHHDLVITIGGISAGERDHFPAAFDAAGVTYALRGAAIQPGKPVIVGRAPCGTIVVGLPGNPVSSAVCATLFIWPIVRLMLGATAPLPWRDIELTASVAPNPRRRAFRPAVLDPVDPNRASVPAWAGSGDLAHTAATHGVVRLPVQDAEVAAGSRLAFLPWPS